MEDPDTTWEPYDISDLPDIRANNLCGSEYRQCVMIDQQTMFVMTCYDYVFKIGFDPVQVAMLSQSGLLVGSFSMYYGSEGDDFVYILGGRSTETDEKVSTCRKYNIKTDQWEYVPGMKEKREKPGVLLSEDQNTLYAFGG